MPRAPESKHETIIAELQSAFFRKTIEKFLAENSF
jgi:hypothetical protein